MALATVRRIRAAAARDFATAFVMLFWAGSGLVMWWQIKATRWPGAVVLVVSAVAATLAGVGMHDLLAAGGR